jgi:CheY-like chemotaxis protein
MKTILLVDDDQQVRELFGLALRRSGYYVIEADSGVAGFEMARHHVPDLILSDIRMQLGDGTTLLHDIRRGSGTKVYAVRADDRKSRFGYALQRREGMGRRRFPGEAHRPSGVSELRASEGSVTHQIVGKWGCD